MSSARREERGRCISHGPDDISNEETNSGPLKSGCKSETGSSLLDDRLTEDVTSDGDPDDRYDIPSRHRKDFEVRWSEQTSGSGNVPRTDGHLSADPPCSREDREYLPRLVNLLKVETFRKLRIPNLHNQRTIQIQELILLPITPLICICRFPPVLVLELWIRDCFSRNDSTDLILVQD